MDTTIVHMCECHAVTPDEMTTCMRLKIKENMQLNRNLVGARKLDHLFDVPGNLL